MFNQRLKLGKFFDIDLYLHWSFALLPLLVAYQVRESGAVAMAFMVFYVLSVFVCVTLHEYGHALAARRYGIGTVDITLLPIGGVARLKRMPRVPWQELVVAVAGPAVNVVIAALLSSVLFSLGELPAELVSTDGAMVQSADVVTESGAVTTPAAAQEAADTNEGDYFVENPSLETYGWMMLFANVLLVLFNMIPAFPMDGGRVLRSILAMKLDYRKATWVASRIGLVCAALMAAIWYWSGQQSFLILIAVFIGYAGLAEAKQVDVSEAVRGLTVRDTMVQSPTTVSMDMPLYQVAELWQSLSATSLPVMSGADTVIGLLELSAVGAAIKKGVDPMTTAGALADHSLPKVHPEEELEDVVLSLPRNKRQVPVVDQDNRLAGMLDLDSIRARGAIQKLLHRDPRE